MKKKNTFKILTIVIIIILIIVSLSLFTTKKEDNSKVRIGYITALTGPVSYLGSADEKAVRLAEEKIKEIYGNESIEIIVEDSQSDAKQAASAANKLITLDDVDVIYVEFTGPSGSVVPIAKDYNKLVIYSSYRTDLLDNYKYSLKTYRNAESECTTFAKIAKEKGISK
jgi:ABC-type branched-subunit amino acid transport system substrate-binding protein